MSTGITGNAVFEPVTTTKKRYILVTGGRASTKSFHIGTIACLITYEKGHIVLFTRYTMVSAEISIIPEFTEKLSLMQVASSFRIRNRDITNLHTDSKILFRGIKKASKGQTASLKSVKDPTTLIIEEAEEVRNEKDFDDIDDSIRKKGVQNRVILIFNPPEESHWLYQRWFKDWLTYIEIDGHKIPVTNHPEVLHIHTTYLDALEHLSESYLAKIEKLKIENPEKYARVFLGQWSKNTEGVCFSNWEEGDFDESLAYCYALDFGYFPDPLAMAKIAVDVKRKRIYIKEEIYELEMSNAKVIKRVGEVIENKRDLIVCDTNESRLFQDLKFEIRTTPSGAEIKRPRYNAVKAIKLKNSIRDDYIELQDWLIIVDPDSYKVKLELNNHVWNDKKATVPIGEFNHLLDDLRYGWRRLTRGKRTGVRKRG